MLDMDPSFIIWSVKSSTNQIEDMSRRQRRVHKTRRRRQSLSVDTSDSMSTTSASSCEDSSANASAIEEITNALTKRASEISSWFSQNHERRMDTVCAGNDVVGDTDTEQPEEDDLQIGTYMSKVFGAHEKDSHDRYRMKKIVHELKMTQLELKDQELKTTMQIAKMAKMENVENMQRDAIKEVKETMKQKNTLISTLKQEKEELSEKTITLEKTVKSLTDEIARYEAIVLNSKV